MTRFHVILDTESLVAHDEHHRYQIAERFAPRPGLSDSGRRPGQRGSADPLTRPRWMFQRVMVASVLVSASHADGNIVPISLNTFSAPDQDEADILKSIFAIVDRLPPDAVELVTYGGVWADVPTLVVRAMKHGLTLPRAWKTWMPWGGAGRAAHIDLMRNLCGSSKMKPSHLAEFAAVLDLPVKMTAAPWRAAEFMKAGQWSEVREMCESDCIATGLLFAAWRILQDGRSSLPVVIDRICRAVEELCPDRSFIPALRQKRHQLFKRAVQLNGRDLDAAA